jgi:hypothetical protein
VAVGPPRTIRLRKVRISRALLIHDGPATGVSGFVEVYGHPDPTARHCMDGPCRHA